MAWVKKVRALCACWALASIIALGGWTSSAAEELLVLTAAPVQAGKFSVLEGIAKPLGWRVRAVFAERLTGEEDAALFRGADAVLFDIPYDPVVETVERKVGRWLTASRLPWLKVQDESHRAEGLDADTAHRLWRYYINGGRRNFTAFFQGLDAALKHRSIAGLPVPIEYPEQGIYHPDAEGIFNDVAAYRRWWNERTSSSARAGGAPVIALAIHKNYLSSDLTAFIDHTIRRLEARGAMPLTFYTPMSTPDGFSALLAPDGGKPLADVVITSQIMLFPEPRRAEFERLGIPVIQAMPFRRGDVADWQADPAGVHLMDVPFYLAQPEYAGVVDAMTAAAVRKGDGQVVPIADQVEAVVGKALALARLQYTQNRDKRVAMFFWNYPHGESNLGASYLNLPRSLEALLGAMKAAGYTTLAPDAQALIPAMQSLLRPFYRERVWEELARAGRLGRLSLADYRRWFDALAPEVRERIVRRWGEPEASAMLQGRGRDAYFPIPRLDLGRVVILPQPPRNDGEGDREKALYHDTRVPVNHYYLAVYLWARAQFGADALVHLGTHGTQEWLPGKERGLWAQDDALLPIADVPVIYPYIVDDVGEAIQAKRRGRALIVSHQTPPFAPAGLHNDLNDLHTLVHEWQSLTEGAVRDRTADAVLRLAGKLKFEQDLKVTAEQARADFPAFLQKLHDWLHELALSNQPQGMHVLGVTQEMRFRLGVVMQMLGKAFVARVDADPSEAFVGDYRDMTRSAAYRFLERHLVQKEPLPPTASADLVHDMENARRWFDALEARPEIDAVLAALDGRHVASGNGGDPIRNPDSLPTGRNLYGFDPSKVPTKAAFEAGQDAVNKLIEAYRAQHGQAPQKLAFTLWSVETMRHYGVLEAQAFYAMGVKPKWDAGGRVNGVELIPREQLGRPRIDVVLSATGLYRDHFPNVMRWLAQGAALAAQANEADNAVKQTSDRLAQQLVAQGMPREQATQWSQVRIFSNASGAYGTGLADASLASDTWDDEKKLAGMYLDKLQYAYGTDMKTWGQRPPGINLFAENLKGVEAAALSRTSNLYGMLTTDDPFQYLGGISLAVRALTGKSPTLYISNLRDSGQARAETADQFLSRELRTRQFHPGWIEALQKEGYSGTTEMLDSINNFWGWQVMAPDVVRGDQWQSFVDVYVRDQYQLGLKDYFEQHNPAALAQMIERMLEAARKDYWQPDGATLRELAERYHDLAVRRDVRTDNTRLSAYVEQVLAAGYGMAAGRPKADASARTPAASAPTPPVVAPVVPVPPPPTVSGMRLERVQSDLPPPDVAWIVALGLLLVTGAGGFHQRLRARSQE